MKKNDEQEVDEALRAAGELYRQYLQLTEITEEMTPWNADWCWPHDPSAPLCLVFRS